MKSVIEILSFENAKKIRNLIFAQEYYATVEGEWIEDTSNKEQARQFRKATTQERKVMAWEHANIYTSALMEDVTKLIKAYGRDFFVDMVGIDLQKAYSEQLKRLEESY